MSCSSLKRTPSTECDWHLPDILVLEDAGERSWRLFKSTKYRSRETDLTAGISRVGLI